MLLFNETLLGTVLMKLIHIFIVSLNRMSGKYTIQTSFSKKVRIVSKPVLKKVELEKVIRDWINRQRPNSGKSATSQTAF